jgi:predicted GNAT superfamily acetyltransferase
MPEAQNQASVSTVPAEADEVVLRPLATHEEYGACVELQKATWGDDFNEVIPATILKIANRVGGLTAGAFRRARLVGFVFGLTGVEDGRLVHWSHMLGVRPEARDAGLGARLKAYQRELLAARGVEVIYWTFDPLVARNAHLNLNKLGAEVREYVPDMYPDSSSTLHRFGTDRFVVGWRVGAADSAGVSERANGRARGVTPGGAPVVNEAGPLGALVDAAVVRIEVPADVQAVPAEVAQRWRASTRDAFVHYLGRSYAVAGFEREPISGRCFYVLTGPER